MFQQLICPHCHQSLERSDQALSCPANHSFDIAKQGYVNLLPVSSKRSKDPGDSKEMVKARRDWLSLGYYEPIAAGVAQLLDGYSKDVHDAGCGEGYYTSSLKPYCGNISGSDISKNAILSAAKSYKDIEFLVASNRALPIEADSKSAILSLFGFPSEDEFRRILKRGGVIIHAEATETHLIEFKQALYDDIKAFRAKHYYPSFNHITTLPIEYEISFSNTSEAIDLLKMTPHYFRAKPDRVARLVGSPPSSVTVSIAISLYQKV